MRRRGRPAPPHASAPRPAPAAPSRRPGARRSGDRPYRQLWPTAGARTHAPGRVRALRIVHQHAGGEIDPPQDLAQLVDLALLAELGDGAEDVRERAPLHLGQDVAPDLQRVPAQRPHPAGRELADLHVARQAGRVEQLRQPVPKSSTMVRAASAGWSRRPCAPRPPSCRSRCRRRTRCGSALAAQAQGGHGQVAGLRADLVAEHHLAGQLRVEGQRRQLLLDRDRRALLEEVGRGVRGQHGRREQRALLGPQQVDAERVAVRRQRGPERQRMVGAAGSPVTVSTGVGTSGRGKPAAPTPAPRARQPRPDSRAVVMKPPSCEPG